MPFKARTNRQWCQDFARSLRLFSPDAYSSTGDLTFDLNKSWNSKIEIINCWKKKVKDLLEHAIFITDGATLCETLHGRGINIRYLGCFLEQIAQHESLSYIHVSKWFRNRITFKLYLSLLNVFLFLLCNVSSRLV